MAADTVRVSDVNCTQASCEAGRGATTDIVGVSVVGQASKQAKSTLGVIILDTSEKLVYKGHFSVKEDGTYRVLVPAGNLQPGQYKFGLITLEKPASVVASGSFTLTAEAPAAAPQPRKGIAGFIDRLNAGPEKQRVSEPGRSAAPPAAPPQPPAAPSAPQPAAKVQPSNSGGGFFFRTFGLAIPGVAYTFDNYATNTRTTTVSSGYVTKSAIRINPDGTYIWNSAWDGKIIQGRWRQEGGAIIVVGGQSGLNWRMERMAKPSGDAVITLWDQNSIWYNGTPLDGK